MHGGKQESETDKRQEKAQRKIWRETLKEIGDAREREEERSRAIVGLVLNVVTSLMKGGMLRYKTIESRARI